MIQVKKTVNFKTIRDKGPNSLNVKDKEVIQVINKKQIKVVVTQAYFLELYYNRLDQDQHKKPNYTQEELSNPQNFCDF